MRTRGKDERWRPGNIYCLAIGRGDHDGTILIESATARNEVDLVFADEVLDAFGESSDYVLATQVNLA